MMDELVQDLVSALEQASEQSKLEELWGGMIPSPLQQRRQIRRRRGRKRFHESSLYPMARRRCWVEASESSMDEAKEYRKNLPSTLKTSLANNSDSDDTTDRWSCVVRSPVSSRQPSWLESDSFTDNNPGRPLRRRRKLKRMTSDVKVRFQPNLHVRENGKKRPRFSPVPCLSGWMGAESDRGRLMGKERWKRKMAEEHRDGPDENMSDGESSSTCSSDPGLFTNDEGRQGDDEQSDWFFEGDCGVGKAVTGLLPNWDPDSSLSLEKRHTRPNFLQPARCSVRGYHAHPDRLLCSAACCLRRDRRRLPKKSTNMPLLVERLRHFSQDQRQRNFWLPPVGKQDRNQLNPLCPVCPADAMSESSHLRCSSSIFRNRQSNFPSGLFSSADTKRRRETEAASITASATTPFHIDHQKEELREGAGHTTNVEAVGPSTPQFSTSAQPESLSLLHEDT
ncbi:G patch domain-containing protein 2-like [Nematolebias whitei]|uniref:G patch domain-containing protein 2-like n=1 Tax=Nematolebias whitei TaxID=451745 RepID=UPI00189B9835|nr:G patch domain-containing protein 2-like [Nematolebias whitei]